MISNTSIPARRKIDKRYDLFDDELVKNYKRDEEVNVHFRLLPENTSLPIDFLLFIGQIFIYH